MCLGLPGRLVSTDGDTGVLDIGGRRVEVNLVFTPGATVGAWIVAHSGMAIRVIPAAEAAAAWDLAEEGARASRRGAAGPAGPARLPHPSPG